MSKAISLSSKEINRVLQTCLLMQNSESKRCSLVLSHAAMRVTEIALLETKTLLYPSGQIREEIHLPSKICKGLKPRTIWITNSTTRVIIQEWIDYRLSKRWGTSLSSNQYQGLLPGTKFIFNNRGRSYSIQPKPRKMQNGAIKTYRACDALESIFRDVYKRCGLNNASSHSGRKSLVSNAVINQGRSLEQMARILGHSDPQTTLDYVVICQKRINEMYLVAL